MFTVVIQHQTDYKTQSRQFATRDAANDCIDRTVAVGLRVTSDRELYTGEPLRRTVKGRDRNNTVWVINLYRY